MNNASAQDGCLVESKKDQLEAALQAAVAYTAGDRTNGDLQAPGQAQGDVVLSQGRLFVGLVLLEQARRAQQDDEAKK